MPCRRLIKELKRSNESGSRRRCNFPLRYWIQSEYDVTHEQFYQRLFRNVNNKQREDGNLDLKPETTYRKYSPTSMQSAYIKVKATGAPIRTTARQFGVPESSLCHKLSGRVDPEAVRSGPPPLFSQEEEAEFVEHLKYTASVGYGYSRAELRDMATEYAIALGRRDKEHPVGHQWYEDFMKRWPELKLLRARGLEIQRAKSTSVESVAKYYKELDKILTKYDLKDKPERLYNIDEKGLSTSHKPPRVVAPVGSKPPAVTTGSRTTVTVIGCGNALGYQVPPFFIFPGVRMRQELLEGKTAGTDGDVSESGWSNGEIFRAYLEKHLLKYLPERAPDKKVLLFYDGHLSHISIPLIKWARSQHLILYVLPAHTSHVCQPLDVGCFGPFERVFDGVCHKFMREHCGEVITRYNICSLGCSAYTHALSVENLQSSFRKSGIYPFSTDAVDAFNFKPAEVQQQQADDEIVVPVDDCASTQVENVPSEFFRKKEVHLREKKRKTKKRRLISSIVSGRAITEDDVLSQIQQHHEEVRAPAKRKSCCKSPLPGPSGSSHKITNKTASPDSVSTDDDDDDSEKCCVCGKFTPDEVRKSTSLIFVKWVKCDNTLCNHWTHLKYCTKIHVVRRGDIFYCHHCNTEE